MTKSKHIQHRKILEYKYKTVHDNLLVDIPYRDGCLYKKKCTLCKQYFIPDHAAKHICKKCEKKYEGRRR